MRRLPLTSSQAWTHAVIIPWGFLWNRTLHWVNTKKSESILEPFQYKATDIQITCEQHLTVPVKEHFKCTICIWLSCIFFIFLKFT